VCHVRRGYASQVGHPLCVVPQAPPRPAEVRPGNRRLTGWCVAPSCALPHVLLRHARVLSSKLPGWRGRLGYESWQALSERLEVWKAAQPRGDTGHARLAWVHLTRARAAGVPRRPARGVGGGRCEEQKRQKSAQDCADHVLERVVVYSLAHGLVLGGVSYLKGHRVSGALGTGGGRGDTPCLVQRIVSDGGLQLRAHLGWRCWSTLRHEAVGPAGGKTAHFGASVAC
jgi:hypothetical protein